MLYILCNIMYYVYIFTLYYVYFYLLFQKTGFSWEHRKKLHLDLYILFYTFP